MNAHTAFDELFTSPLPIGNPVISPPPILEDWATSDVDPLEVDRERGVIPEEWRLVPVPRRGSATRRCRSS